MGGVSSVCRVHSTLPILKIAKTAERVGGGPPSPPLGRCGKTINQFDRFAL